MKKSYVAAALALTSCLVLGTAAASQSQNVTATFRPDMKLKVNGTTYTVRDTTGKEVSPLVYNGTTYLPLASLGQLLGGGSLLGCDHPDRDRHGKRLHHDHWGRLLCGRG